ncbi:MAG: septation protein A [Rhodospirillales bacterium]|nr:septation protein A [Rhodospirillales bacterium]
MTGRLHPALKFALEIGPLLVFFFINARAGIFWATGAFMAALAVSLVTMYVLARRIPILPVVTGVFVLVFGGLTLILQDELFIKLKPTIVNALFGAILLGGLFAGKSFLKSLLGEAIQMTDRGWRLLTFRWAFFFFVLAVLNEIVWRNYTTDEWVTFKVFGIMPLTILFSLTQLPTMFRHRIEEDAA